MKFNKALLLTILLSGLAAMLGAQTNYVRIDESNLFRAFLQVDRSNANARQSLELSSDMSTWDRAIPLTYSTDPDAVTTSSDSGVSIYASTDNGDGTWTVGFEFETTVPVFARIGQQTGPFSADPTVTTETANLLKNLHLLGWDPTVIAFGTEFPLTYHQTSGSADTDPTTSDSKDIVGDHPGVHGSDFHFMIDKPWEKDTHVAAAHAAYDAGAIVTIDYHWHGKYSDGHTYDARDAQAAFNIVNDDDSAGDVTWFYEDIDAVLEIINNDLKIPFVFRPFHEMNGNWFWWGSRLPGGTDTYKALYRKLFDYMSTRTDYVLWCWSPDYGVADAYYPGDDYVDVVGRDIYGPGNIRSASQWISMLQSTVAFAETHGKVAAFTETGFSASSPITYHTSRPNWWKQDVLDPLLASDSASKIAWVLTWINVDSWSGPYIPYAASPQASKDGFKAFYDDPATLFQNEVGARNMYDAPPTD